MRALAITVLALAACGDPAGEPPDAAVDAVVGVPCADAGPPVTNFPAQLVLGPAQGTISDPFTIAVTGAGAQTIGAASFTNDAGTLTLDGTSVTSFLYMTTPFGAGLTLYQGFAVGPSRWDVFWLYCTNGTALTSIWDEGVDGPPIFVENATGTCNGGNSTLSVPVNIGASTIASPTPVADGYSVRGADIDLATNGTGTITLGGVAMPVVVFGTVNCETGCGTPGWFELHSVVWDAAHQRAIFVIIYLEDGAPGSVELAYARALPDLTDPIGTMNLPATWSLGGGSCPGAKPLVAPRGFGVPPPSHRR
jgi:hypothetical protein